MESVDNAGTAQRWDGAYEHGDATCSWYQERPSRSMAMFERAGVTPEDSVIDVGGGAARLVDELVGRRFCDLTVLDVSEVGLGHARARLRADAEGVTWLVADVLGWAPTRTYRVWHDRAVLHFLSEPAELAAYAQVAAEAVAPGGHALIAGFAPNGPQRCSGLPVTRRSPEQIAALLAPAFSLLQTRTECHRTPSGAEQWFAYALLRRQ